MSSARSSTDSSPINQFVEIIYQELLPGLELESLDPDNPVVVHRIPKPWQFLGAGNYAAVVCHPDAFDKVVKVYAPGRPGLTGELEVYRRLGSHPAFSECLHAGKNFLVLKRLHGTTLYDCMHLGRPIPRQVIVDIDQALEYARRQGLHPHDVHGRNVMMWKGRGLVVDVSDFLHEDSCSAWSDLKKAYYWLYRPFLCPLRLRVPYSILDFVRKSYRFLRRLIPYRS